MTQNWDVATLKIDQSAFIQDLLEKKNLTDWNAVNIPMKASSFIKIYKKDNYKKANIKIY